jgi:hypothetical protein
MLHALEHLERNEAEKVLASFAKTMLPTPDERAPEFSDRDLAGRLLRELNERARVDRVRDPAEARGRVFSVLAQELSNYALKSANLDEIKARLGARGDLRPDSYKIEIPPVILELQKRGIRSNQIRSAISEPSAVEHLSWNGFDQADETLLSIFAKTTGPVNAAHSFTLLVEAQRQNATLKVLTAWRVYNSDILWPSPATPLTLLKAFVDAFGVPFAVGNGQPTKFVLYERIPLPEKPSSTNLVIMHSLPLHPFEAHQMFRIDPQGYAEVAIAYVIDLTIYHSALTRQGINVRR